MKKEKESFDFESDMKRQLSQRELTPSENAWDRVQLLRERKPVRKKPRLLLWAASMAAVIAIALVLFSGEKKIGTSLPVVQTEKPAANQPLLPVKPAAEREETAIVASEAPETLSRPIPVGIETVTEMPLQSAIETEMAGIQQQKISEITASVMALAESGKPVPEDDIDALINKARIDIASGQGLSQPTDASALLRDSENEMTEEFRSNVFKELIKHKRIRIAFGDGR